MKGVIDMRTIILYSVKDIAEVLGVETSTVRGWVKNGRIHPFNKLKSNKEGHEFTVEEFMRFISENPKYSKPIQSVMDFYLDNRDKYPLFEERGH